MSECTAEQAACRNVMQNRQHIGIITEQAAYRNVLQNRQHIGITTE